MRTSLSSRSLATFAAAATTAAFGLIPFAAAAASAAPSSSGTTYYANVDGSDSNACITSTAPCKTIQAAVDKTSAGDTVVVAAGTYNEDVKVTAGITLTGAGDGATILDGQGIAATNDNPGNLTVSLATGSQAVSISGFTFTNPAGSDDLEPELLTLATTQASDTVSITDDEFLEGTVDTDASTDGPIGIATGVNAATTTVSGNTFSGLFQGILAEDSGPMTVHDNTFTKIIALNDDGTFYSGEGVFFLEDVNGSYSGTVSDNTFSGYAGNGIKVRSGYDLGGCTDRECDGSASLAITGNSFALQDAATISDPPPAAAAAIYLQSLNAGDSIDVTDLSGNTGTVAGATQTIQQVPGEGTISIASSSSNSIVPATPPTLTLDAPATADAGAKAQTFTGTLDNTGGTTITNARYDVSFTSSASITAGDVELEYDPTGSGTYTSIPLIGSTADGGAITGYFGPTAGFTVPPGAQSTTPFEVSFVRGTPSGTLTGAVSLDQVNHDGSAVIDSGLGTASTSTAITAAPLPTISSVAPPKGEATGGTQVTITGTNLDGATAVDFGDVAATSFTVEPDGTEIVAVAPADENPAGPGGSDTVGVSVTTPAGSSDTSIADQFTYEFVAAGAPIVTSVNPTSATSTKGASVVINGSGFTGVTGSLAVSFQSQSDGTSFEPTSYTVVSDTAIYAVLPPAAAGTYVTVVENAAGPSDQLQTSGDVFTYNTPDAPVVSSASPITGTTHGGTTVTITGSNLSGATAVSFGDTPAASYTVDSDTQITAVTPAEDAGKTTVSVTTPGGSSDSDVSFTFVTPAPAITALSPATGTTAGGNTVTITGTDLTGASAVSFGDVAATSVAVAPDGDSLTAIAPAESAGPVTVTVTTPAGTSASAATYTYVVPVVAPTLNAAPASVTYGTTVTISGTTTPGATVAIYFHVSGQNGYDARRSLVADGSGAFSTTYVAVRDERFYASTTAGISVARLTQVAPTVNGNAAVIVKKGSTVTITGTAGADSGTVLIHFHRAGTPENDYSIVRSVTVNSNGTWSRPYLASVDYRFYVTSTNGLATPTYLYQAR